MRIVMVTLTCVMALWLCGCSHEPEIKPKTLPEIQAEIDKAQNDPNIPPQAKGIVLGHLQQEMDKAKQREASVK